MFVVSHNIDLNCHSRTLYHLCSIALLKQNFLTSRDKITTKWIVLSWYRSGTVISKSFVDKDFLRNKWKSELTVHFKHEMIGKHFTETSNKKKL